MKVVEVYEQEFDLWDDKENKVVRVKAVKAGNEWKVLGSQPYHRYVI
jgi:hypothetical protein